MVDKIIRNFIEDNGETIPIVAKDLGDGTYALGISVSGISGTGGMTNPMSAINDIIVGGASGTPERLPVGNATEVLTVVSGVGVAWMPASGGMVNPMTSLGDIIVGDTDGVPSSLGAGNEGEVLTIVDLGGGVLSPSWAASTGGFTNPMTTQGDLITMNASPAADRLAIGATAGMVLESNGVTPGWIQKWSQAIFTFEGTLVSGASNSFRLYNLEGVNRTITRVAASVSTAPTGADIIVDVHKDGTTLFTTQSNRPTITISGFTTTQDTLEVDSWNADEYLTAHLDQVGTVIAGADLALYVYYITTPHSDGGGPV